MSAGWLPAPWQARGTARTGALVQAVFRTFGVDRAIAYTLIARGWSLVAGPLTLVWIARFLKPEEQGFYYTFGSVISLNIFFELGLTYVLLQFASHEKAHLEWTSAGTLAGSAVSINRLAALLRLALRWYAVAAGLVLLLVLPAGLVFFARNSSPIGVTAWRLPWVWLVSVSAMNLLAGPLFAILEGCGKVSQIASMRVGQSVASSLGLWLTLWCHGALLAGPAFQTINLGYGLAWVIFGYSRLFRSLLGTHVEPGALDWWREVWPFQWRIALSWLSGYFIFQIFNPVLFATQGPVVAGQMGMSLSLCSALLGVSMAWMNTKASPFGVLVARQRWGALDTVFWKTLRQSLLVVAAGGVVLYACVVFLRHRDMELSKRLINPLPFAFLLLATAANHVLFCEAQYLRAHKVEPFLWMSVTFAVLTGASVILLAKPFGAAGVSTGYLLSCIVALAMGTRLFVRKRREWHCLVETTTP